MRIVITGGHFTPAYSIIQKLKDNNQLLIVGRKHAFDNDSSITLEYKVCQELSIPFKNLTTGRFQRNFGYSSLFTASKFPLGVYKAIKILKNFQPDVCVTFGGYVGLPVAIASKILGIPVILHEQTQKAGLSAKLISRFASVILISFESSKKFFPSNKVVVTGNPLRPEFESAKKISFKHPSIYITGGSTGAHFLNELVEKSLPQLQDFEIYHQTGNSAQFDDYKRLRAINKPNYHVEDFYSANDVFSLMKSVDLVISRSGINTVNEIIASKAVSLLIPLPHGQVNEQLDNAKYVSDLGIGEYILQKDISPLIFVRKINGMIKEKNKYKNSFNSIQHKIIFDSADRIISEIYKHGRSREYSQKKGFD